MTDEEASFEQTLERGRGGSNEPYMKQPPLKGVNMPVRTSQDRPSGIGNLA